MRVKSIIVVFCIMQAVMSVNSLRSEIRGTSNDWEYIFSGVFKPETFYAKNPTWLNNLNPFDRSYLSRHVLDLSVDILYGAQTFGTKIAELLFQVRNKGIWGNPFSIASTTEADVKILEAINGIPHSHAFPRHIFWIRQIWLQFNIGEAFSLPFGNVHTFTIGSFPFQLGRGIALGDAYAVGPEALGFYADSAIDQYAFGAKFSGELLTRMLSYDLYTAILQNNSSNLA